MSSEILKAMDSQSKAAAQRIAKSVSVYRILYKSRGHNVVGFIIETKKHKLSCPCIIWNRGGSREFGAIVHRHLFGRMAEIAAHGYILIASQYSGNDGSEGVDRMGGDDIHDVLNLYRILSKYKRADVSRIGMYGWSRGGMMTYIALSKVKWIRAAVVGGAPTNQIEARRFRPGWSKHQKEMYGGGRIEDVRRSPMYWPERLCKTTPILMMHGGADWRVSPLDSLRFAELLYTSKVPFRLVVFEGGDHALTEFNQESWELTMHWFKKYLSKARRLPDLGPHGK